jgi:hypothetical protein
MSDQLKCLTLAAGTLAWAVVLCLALAGAVNVLLMVLPSIAPVVSIGLAIGALALGYYGFRFMLDKLFGGPYG